MTTYPNRFAGRVAVITGGASGLGLKAAERIVAEGGKVALWDMSAENLEASKKSLGAHTQQVDVSDYKAVAAAAEATAKAMGKIDILICSAGITGPTVPVTEFPVEGWLKVMAINLNGLFYCCREVAPHMEKNGYGRIVNIASVAGKEGNPNASAYSASKAAVIGFTKSLGKELATKNIVVNAVTPAVFESPILAQMPQSQVDYMKSKIPMGRLGKPDEIAAIVLFAASEECTFTTASTFDVSGGRTTF